MKTTLISQKKLYTKHVHCRKVGEIVCLSQSVLMILMPQCLCLLTCEKQMKSHIFEADCTHCVLDARNTMFKEPKRMRYDAAVFDDYLCKIS